MHSTPIPLIFRQQPENTHAPETHYYTKPHMPGGAVGNSGPNGFFAGGEDFGGKFIGKAPNNRVDTVVADAPSS